MAGDTKLRSVSAETEPPLETIPVSPTTGLDPEIRAFMSRVMTGYEASNRRLAELCETLAASAVTAQKTAQDALESQIRNAALQEDLISQRHIRELESEAARARQGQMAEATNDARVLIKLFVKKMIGIPLTGNDSHGLQDLLASFSNEQIGTLVESGELKLTPAQRQLVASALTSLAESESKKLEGGNPIAGGVEG